MSKTKEIIFIKSPSHPPYRLAYFFGQKADLKADLANKLIQDEIDIPADTNKPLWPNLPFRDLLISQDITKVRELLPITGQERIPGLNLFEWNQVKSFVFEVYSNKTKY